MFDVTDDLRNKITRIQEQALIGLGANLAQAQSISNNKSQIKGEKVSVEEEYQFFKDNPHVTVPEYAYDTSYAFFEFMRTCRVTPYDDAPFLQRFANIIPLCHEFYTGGEETAKRNVVLTSLPFLNLNGICTSEENETHVVFLNEGILATIPGIYQHLMPLCEPELFGQPTQENMQTLYELIAGLYFFKSTYADTRENAGITKPHAREKWLFQAALRESVEGGTDSKMEFKHPSEYPFDQSMAQFLACRGAFVYLLGHEFSHVYNDHCSLTGDSGIDLRDHGFTQYVQENFERDFNKFKGTESNFENFNVHQPMEEEADAHALQCVVKYCADNDLDDQRALCVLVGALGTFVVMHIQEQFAAIHDIGLPGAKAYLRTHPYIRNMFFGGEHPCPISRMEMALFHEQHRSSPAHELLAGLNHGLVQLCQQISKEIFTNGRSIESFLGSAELLNFSPNQLFDSPLTLGANDASFAHHVKARNHFHRSKKNVFSFFKR